MYHDTRRRPLRYLLIGLAAVLLLVLICGFSAHIQSRDLREEGAAAIEAAISRTALQCYVVEGVYPPTLGYLEEHYGLQVNTRDYYVTYDAFASNLPPTVRAVHKADP